MVTLNILPGDKTFYLIERIKMLALLVFPEIDLTMGHNLE